MMPEAEDEIAELFRRAYGGAANVELSENGMNVWGSMSAPGCRVASQSCDFELYLAPVNGSWPDILFDWSAMTARPYIPERYSSPSCLRGLSAQAKPSAGTRGDWDPAWARAVRESGG
jgi:hypothetical protein